MASERLPIEWQPFASPVKPEIVGDGLFKSYIGATLTAKAFDTIMPGLGKWLIKVSAWLFAFSTIVAWSYYGEQGIVFIIGERSVVAYKAIYCLLPIIATLGWIESDKDLDNLTGIGTGVMLMGNLPIMWLFGY